VKLVNFNRTDILEYNSYEDVHYLFKFVNTKTTYISALDLEKEKLKRQTELTALILMAMDSNCDTIWKLYLTK
jgi:sulfur relay (sulfurtransferase) DsrF/TusC family protein